MRYWLALTMMGVLLSVGVSMSDTYGQSAVASNVIINEVEINPPGDDSKSISEWVEIYNPTDTEINLSGWQIASTTVLKKTLTIQAGTTIQPGQFLTFSYLPLWFTDASEVVELRNESGVVIDRTPTLTDFGNDFKSWQRVYDGLDTDSDTDWKFVTSTAGSSNGKLVFESEKDEVSISVTTDKSQYLFGDIVTISGKVSEQVFVEKPFFRPGQILIEITGPSYQDTVTLYPDRNLDYETTLHAQKTLGFNQGSYEIRVSYAGAFDSTQFSIVSEITTQEQEIASGELQIATDRDAYMPGQTVTISAFTNDIIPFEGLKFQVIDPLGTVTASGTLFPDSGTRSVRGGSLTGDPDAQFVTTVFMDTVRPVYGTYKITAEYSKQLATTTFELNKDVKEDTVISLKTDKDLYTPGDTVTVTGRLNKVWIPALDLEVVQTKNIALGGKSDGGGFNFKITDIVRTEGDGTFSYSFKIPQKDARLGDYRVKVSKEIGSVTTTFGVVQDAEQAAVVKQPLSIDTDKEFYDLGEKLVIKGTVKDPVQRAGLDIEPISIFMTDEENKKLSIVGLPKSQKTREQGGLDVSYQFSAVPDFAGNFKVETSVAPSFFKEGTYHVHAKYAGLSTSSSFIVIDPVKTGDRLVISLDKRVYGLGDTVKISGLVPTFTQGTSVDITVIKPNGETDKSSVIPENSRFSWSWQAPLHEKPQSVKEAGPRATGESNFGIYKIRLSTSSLTKEISFKLSPNPEEDTFVTKPLTINTDKPIYMPGDKLKVSGFVEERQQGSEGLVVPERVSVKVQKGTVPHDTVYEGFVYPKNGRYDVQFDLPATVFEEGLYRVVSKYQDSKEQVDFRVESDFVVGGDDPVSLNVSLDKDEYVPGETVMVTGKPNKLVYLEKYDISVIKQSEKTSITCGTFYCGKHAGPVTTVRPSPSGSFAYEYTIPAKPSSVGNYEITVDVGFDTISKKFQVVESKPSFEEKPPSPKIIDKVTGASNDNIEIVTSEKNFNNTIAVPKAIRGILISTGMPSDTNLQVTKNSTCVIGPSADCLVMSSTRSERSVYSTVDIDGSLYKVRYSGADARLERFTILPSSPDGVLPPVSWGVEVIKDQGQPSRFNYQINYEKTE